MDNDLEPDSHGSSFIFVGWNRNRIRIGNKDPDPEGPK
jgi:hypothetical protein